MYYWIYKSLPGEKPAKIALSIAIIAIILALLFFIVFPKISLILVSSGLVYR